MIQMTKGKCDFYQVFRKSFINIGSDVNLNLWHPACKSGSIHFEVSEQTITTLSHSPIQRFCQQHVSLMG